MAQIGEPSTTEPLVVPAPLTTPARPELVPETTEPLVPA